MSDDNELSFEKHLTELRQRIIRSLFFILMGAGGAVAFAPQIIRIFIEPIKKIDSSISFYTFSPPEIFIFYMQVIFWGGLVISFPFWFAQIILFILPALKQSEKKMFWAVLCAGVFLFIFGILFAHSIVMPTVIEFLHSFNLAWGIEPMWNIHYYFHFLFLFYLVFGVSFEMPVVIVLLTYTGIVSSKEISNARKYLIVLLFIAAALLTPPDVITQIALAGPLWILFELGLLVSKLLEKISGIECPREDNI